MAFGNLTFHGEPHVRHRLLVALLSGRIKSKRYNPTGLGVRGHSELQNGEGFLCKRVGMGRVNSAHGTK